MLMVSRLENLFMRKLMPSYPGRSTVFDILSRGVLKGRLVVKDADGAHEFGTLCDPARLVTITVHNARMWTRIITSHDLGCKLP